MPLKKKKEDQFWLNHYQEWKNSGHKQKKYCLTQGLSIHIFRANICRIRKKNNSSKKSRFLPVPAKKLIRCGHPEVTESKSTCLKLCFNSHLYLEIPEGFSQETLFQTIKVLEQI
jgi:hypothetical protein